MGAPYLVTILIRAVVIVSLQLMWLIHVIRIVLNPMAIYMPTICIYKQLL